jgi:hypothetical protein
VKDPTDLSAAYPYGGTELGQVTDEAFRYGATHRTIEAEEWGNQVVEVVHGGTSCVFACHLRGFDDDAISAMFLDTAATTPSLNRAHRLRTTQGRAGTLMSANSMILLFVPKARIRHHAILMWNAAPVLSAETALALHMSSEVTIPVMWYGLPDATGRVAEVRKFVDMVSLI